MRRYTQYVQERVNLIFSQTEIQSTLSFGPIALCLDFDVRKTLANISLICMLYFLQKIFC